MPVIQDSLPFSGSTPMSRHASWTGAEVATRRRGPKTRVYLVTLSRCGALTDAYAAELLAGVVAGRSSICSIRQHVIDAGLVAAVDLVMGSARAKNTRWGLTAAGRAAVDAMLAEKVT